MSGIENIAAPKVTEGYIASVGLPQPESGLLIAVEVEAGCMACSFWSAIGRDDCVRAVGVGVSRPNFRLWSSAMRSLINMPP